MSSVSMENSTIFDVNVESPQPTLHIPTEVCENVIDMLYSFFASDTVKDIATLRSCALVCRAWRVRSQSMLFYKVQLPDLASLHKLAAILDAGQHLRQYVYKVCLTGYHLHTTTSVFALFPAVFAGKLPKLEFIYVIHLLDSYTEWLPRPSDPPKFKWQPYIPLHRRFPALLSSFTATSRLYLEHTTFLSFTETARMLHGLPNLEELWCYSVRWITHGGSPPGAVQRFTMQPDWVARRDTPLPPFAPKLRKLSLWDMHMYEAERLIWTRGPHLSKLDITVPPLIGTEDLEQNGIGLLRPCTGLRTLTLYLTSQFSESEKDATVFATSLLAPWKPHHHETTTLVLRSFRQASVARGAFLDALRLLGAIIEASLQVEESPFPTGKQPEAQRAVRYGVCITIYDWEAEKTWWADHIGGCFPSWERQRRLSMNFCTPLSEEFEWAPEENPSNSGSTPCR